MWHTLKQRIRQIGGVIGITFLVAGFVILGNVLGWFQVVEWVTLDQFFQWRLPEPMDSRIVIVTVDESDLTFVQNWPMSDRKMALMLNNIKAHQPRLIGLDIFRDLEVPPGHQELVEVMTSTPNLIGIEKVGGETVAPSPTLKELNQVAAADYVLDSDGKVRRGLILVGSSYGLGARLASLYLEVEGITLEAVDTTKQIYRLGKGIFVPLTPEHEGGYIGADTAGYQILFNFRGGLESFPHISLQEVLENQIPEGLMGDRIILIGVTAPSLNDNFLTPISHYPIPGVVVHANMTSQMVSAALDDRLLLRPLTQTQNQVWIALLSLMGTMGCWFLLEIKYLNNYLRLVGVMITLILVGLCLFLFSYLAFLSGWIFLFFSPFLSFSIGSILVTNYHYQWQLNQTNKRLAKANYKLEEYSQNLEIKVQERTQDLQATLNHLRSTQTDLIHAEKMAALGQMVAGIAHEINNPISFIYGNVEYAINYASDLLDLLELYGKQYPQPEQTIQDLVDDIDLDYLQTDFLKLLNSMKIGSVRIREIVQSLRTFSRLDEAEVKQVNLHEGLESTLMILNSRLHSNSKLSGIKIIKDYGKLPPIKCFAGQLNQVFLNVITNAIDALHEQQMTEGNSAPQIKITTNFQENKTVMISIQDNGPGIPKSIQNRLFDPFFTTKPVGKGTGLGLAISHSIVVDKHKGKLHCFSTLGEGAEFKIELPIKVSLL